MAGSLVASFPTLASVSYRSSPFVSQTSQIDQRSPRYGVYDALRMNSKSVSIDAAIVCQSAIRESYAFDGKREGKSSLVTPQNTQSYVVGIGKLAIRGSIPIPSSMFWR